MVETKIGSREEEPPEQMKLAAAPNASTVNFTLDGTGGHTYFDGTGAERGATTTCTNNGG
jgi:hypothetical protein